MRDYDLESAMKRHNWFYQYSSDPDFTQGKFERDHILNLMKEAGKERALEMWNTYAPGVQRSAFPEYLFEG